MIINIMRHAKIEFGKDQPKMEERHITPEAAKWVKITVESAHRELGFSPDWIISSPLLRAKETAEIVAKSLGKESKLIFEDILLGEGDVRTVYRRLRKLGKNDSVLLVSHFPLIGKLTDDLLGGNSNVGFFSGSTACVQCGSYPGRRKGMQVWLLPPRMFFDGKKWPT